MKMNWRFGFVTALMLFHWQLVPACAFDHLLDGDAEVPPIPAAARLTDPSLGDSAAGQPGPIGDVDSLYCPPDFSSAASVDSLIRIGSRTYGRVPNSRDWTQVGGDLPLQAAGTGASGTATGRFAMGSGRLPPVDDPNSIAYRPTSPTTSLDVPALPFFDVLTPASGDPKNPDFAFNVELRPGIYYDTGYDNAFGIFNPATIALNGSSEAHRRGQVTFYNFNSSLTDASEFLVPAKVSIDTQSRDLLSLGQAQLLFDFYSPSSTSLDMRYGFFRLDLDQLGDSSPRVLIGKGPTMFGDIATSPVTINSGGLPVGMVSTYLSKGDSSGGFTGVPQVRYSQFLVKDRVEIGASVEEQSLADVSAKHDAVVLNRLPVVVGRVRWTPDDSDFTAFQLAGLYRNFTIDSVDYSEHSADGYGLSLTARFKNAAQTDALFGGFAIGRGLGNYLVGGGSAAVVVSPIDVRSVGSLGTYAGVEHIWVPTPLGGSLLSTAAIAFLESDIGLASENYQLRQGWVNLLWQNSSKSFAGGLEWQYGRRETVAGASGDDHRIGLVMQVNFGSKNAVSRPEDPTKAASAATAAGAMQTALTRDNRKRL
jgi:hypothetical protein